MRMSNMIAASLLLSMSATPLAAQATADPHQRFTDSISTDEILQLDDPTAMESLFLQTLNSDPEFQETEATCPGLARVLLDVGMPIIMQSSRRSAEGYRAKLLVLARERLSAEQASGAADFFTGETGQQLLRLTLDHSVEKSSMSELLSSEDQSISAESFEADKAATRQAMLQNVDHGMLAAAGQQIANSNWGAAFLAMRPQIQQLQLEMANSDLSPEESSALDEAYEAAAAEHIDSCVTEE